MTVKELENEIEYLNTVLARIERLIGIYSTWTLLALSKEKESYGDTLIRLLKDKLETPR